MTKEKSTFKVTVMNADPKVDGDAENNSVAVGEKSEKIVGEKLTERQKTILKHIEQNKVISAKEISALLQITDRTVEREIQKLREVGILERRGGDRGGYWKIK